MVYRNRQAIKGAGEMTKDEKQQIIGIRDFCVDEIIDCQKHLKEKKHLHNVALATIHAYENILPWLNYLISKKEIQKTTIKRVREKEFYGKTVKQERDAWIKALGALEQPERPRMTNIQVERNKLRLEMMKKMNVTGLERKENGAFN